MNEEDYSRAAVQRYINAQPFLNLLRKYGSMLTMAEFGMIKRQALDGDIKGAYDTLNERLEEKRR